MARRRLPLVAALIAAAALAAGCGAEDEPDTSATTDWAGSVCSELSAWRAAIGDAAASVTEETPTRETIEAAVDDVKQATDELAGDLEDLGRPETEAGQEAQDTVNTLSDRLRDGVETIEDSVNDAEGVEGALTAVSTVSGTLVTMGNQVSSALDELEQLDAGGELDNAFDEAESCDSLRTDTQ